MFGGEKCQSEKLGEVTSGESMGILLRLALERPDRQERPMLMVIVGQAEGKSESGFP